MHPMPYFSTRDAILLKRRLITLLTLLLTISLTGKKYLTANAYFCRFIWLHRCQTFNFYVFNWIKINVLNYINWLNFFFLRYMPINDTCITRILGLCWLPPSKMHSQFDILIDKKKQVRKTFVSKLGLNALFENKMNVRKIHVVIKLMFEKFMIEKIDR